MYHVSSDKRTQRSAELVWEALEQCLQEKPLNKIHVSDLHEKTYVSRATFYRLFDTVEDVLSYRCDLIYQKMAAELSQRSVSSKRDEFLFFIESWLNEKTLIRTLAANNLMGILYQTHLRNGTTMDQLFETNEKLDPAERDYFVSLLTSVIPAAMTAWYQHGERESPEEVYRAVSRAVTVLEREIKV